MNLVAQEVTDRKVKASTIDYTIQRHWNVGTKRKIANRKEHTRSSVDTYDQ